MHILTKIRLDQKQLPYWSARLMHEGNVVLEVPSKTFNPRNNGKHWKSKISTKDADFIRDNFKKKHSALELSAMFNLDLSTVYSLLRGETWNKHNDKIRVFKRGRKLE